MKRLATALALAATLAFAGGCANIGPAYDVLTGSVAQSAPVTTAQAEKVLTVAHLALNTISVNILAATDSCVKHHDNSCALHGDNAATAKIMYDTASDALTAADQIDAVANAQGVIDKVDAAETLIAQINKLVPHK